ncbi:uncharacterized protein LOC143367503 [Andrena cerasifolii]|uniref:uncharacterized protein LOC143367503 n=1 Tax=Andrena cerasifolii TaxID=2819439 RepID=UPI004037FD0B
MDNFVDARGKKSKRELCLFNSTNASFENLLFTKHNIRTLIIIGQRNIRLLSAIAELIHIQELWIVECGIKEVPSFKENCRLEKLYLSSNEISCIPNLDACLSLKVLFLPGNNICDLKNLQKLIYLEELNLADNKLERINKIPLKKSELQYINLAGNHLRFIRDIRNLSQFRKLKSLVFADLLYGECPVVALCNYRAYVIYHLPDIEKLDHYFIYKKERHWINQFFKKQITYYNVFLHKQINEHFNSLKRSYKEYENEMLNSRNQFYAIKMKKDPLKNTPHDEPQNTVSRMELNASQFAEKKQLAIVQSKTSHQQVKINADYCGNIKFVEYDATPANTVIQLCKQFLEESLCLIVKHNTGITGLKLFKVTKVSNKELDRFNVEEDENLQSDLNNMILKILITPGVTDIQKWPFNFFKTDLFTGNELMVTNCLAVADAEWLNKMFDMKKHEHTRNLANMCQKRRVCVLLQAPIFNSREKNFIAAIII